MRLSRNPEWLGHASRYKRAFAQSAHGGPVRWFTVDPTGTAMDGQLMLISPVHVQVDEVDDDGSWELGTALIVTAPGEWFLPEDPVAEVMHDLWGIDGGAGFTPRLVSDVLERHWPDYRFSYDDARSRDCRGEIAWRSGLPIDAPNDR